MNLLVTGSSGFVGSRVMELAKKAGWFCIGSQRKITGNTEVDNIQNVIYKEIASDESWDKALIGIDCIIHCAAKVHQMTVETQDLLSSYREVNTYGTINLAKQAAEAGVKRFIYISSIKVNGEKTKPGSLFTQYNDIPPNDPYGLSKFEAENELKELSKVSGMDVVIIRPPLVYGPGVKANFLTMIRSVDKKMPLPLRSINNHRSMVFLDNLVDLILKCVEHPNAANKTFLVSDNDDISLSSLLALIAKSLNQINMTFPFPTSLLKLVTQLIGRPEIGSRLCDNLQLDISETKDDLSWLPPYSVEYGIQKTVDEYLKNKTL